MIYVIPTYNRPVKLRVLLAHLRSCGVKEDIIIADSSSFNAKEQNRIACKQYDAIYLDFDKNIAPNLKIIKTLDKVSSEFLAIFPDDNILVPQTINNCRSFLVENSDYVSAWGYVLNSETYKDIFDIYALMWFTPSFDAGSGVARMHRLLNRYDPYIWGVHRTDAFRKSMELSLRVGKRIVWQEISIVLSLALQGKIKRLDQIVYLRDGEKPTSSLIDIDPFYAFLERPSLFFTEYRKYRLEMLRFYLENVQRYFSGEGKVFDFTKFFDLCHMSGFQKTIEPAFVSQTAEQMINQSKPELVVRPDIYEFHGITQNDHQVNFDGLSQNLVLRQAVLNTGRPGLSLNDMTDIIHSIRAYISITSRNN